MTENDARQREQRKVFQENLIKEGIELEIEDKSQSFDEKTFFVKLHLPWRIEARYAEVMNLKLPIKRFITISVKDQEKDNGSNNRFLRKFQNLVKKYWSQFRNYTEYDYGLIEKGSSQSCIHSLMANLFSQNFLFKNQVFIQQQSTENLKNSSL